MGTNLLPIIGSLVTALIIFLLGLLLHLVKQNRIAIETLDEHRSRDMKEAQLLLDAAKKEIMDRVQKPDCVREMTAIKFDIQRAVDDIRNLERGRHGNQR
jgi:hypothetical protein